MDSKLSQSLPLNNLWGLLTNELIDLYDAHHVCMAAGQTIATFTSRPTIIFLHSPLEDHYNIWLCMPDQHSEQFLWQDDNNILAQLLHAEDVITLPTEHFLTGPVYDLDADKITITPFYKSWFGFAPSGAVAFIGDGQDLLLDKQELQSLTHYLTTFLERAFLRYRTEQQEIVFDVINDITLSLTATLSLKDIFDEVANPIRRIVNAESVSIGLYNPISNELIFVRELLGPSFSDLPTIRLKPGQGIAGWVLECKKSALVNDVYNDPRFSSKPDKQSGFITKSILCVPLMVEGNAIGILEAVNKNIGRFDNPDLELMQAIANPLAIALANADLHGEVLAEKRRVEMIFNNMSEGMLTTDGKGIITSANDALLTLLKSDLASVSYKPAKEIIKARRHNLNDFIDLVLAAEDNETPNIACEIYAEYSSEAVPVLISGACIHNEKGDLIEAVFVFSDLREIREVERMRDDFFHNIVHELRTPLATILMYARLLKKQEISAEKSTRFISTIEHESDRLQTMVRQMLALAKMEAREIQRSQIDINLNRLFDEIISPLSDAAINKGLHFNSQIEPNLPLLAGNHEILYSIFKNLIDNAVKFTQQGTIQVNAWHADNQLHVMISDQGIGIPQEAIPNLFRRFYRAQTAVEQGIAGTGLGLYMVKEGVEKHNGQIEMSSEIGKGTIFNISLPLSP